MAGNNSRRYDVWALRSAARRPSGTHVSCLAATVDCPSASNSGRVWLRCRIMLVDCCHNRSDVRRVVLAWWPIHHGHYHRYDGPFLVQTVVVANTTALDRPPPYQTEARPIEALKFDLNYSIDYCPRSPHNRVQEVVKLGYLCPVARVAFCNRLTNSSGNLRRQRTPIN